MEGNFLYLPEEIVLRILARLPEQSLSRFRCVSKQWSCWISQIKSSCRRKVMVQCGPDIGSDVEFWSIDEKAQAERVDLPREGFDPRKVHIKSSCDGLLLIYTCGDFFLWNPTNYFCTKILSYKDVKDYEYDNTVAGLCFDPYNSEYKVVLLVHWLGAGYKGDHVLVGSSRNNSWVEIRFPYPKKDVYSGPVLNNFLHWYVGEEVSNFNNIYNRDIYHHKIIYFDPRKNEFVEFPMPEPKAAHGDRISGLGVLDGCLCMARCIVEGWAYYVEVLVMKEYRVKESWQTLFKTGELFHYTELTPLCYTDKKDKVLINIDTKIVTLDLTRARKKVVTMEADGYTYYDEDEKIVMMVGDGYIYDDEETLDMPSKYRYLIEKGDLEEEEDAEQCWEEPKRRKGKKKAAKSHVAFLFEEESHVANKVFLRNTFDMLSNCQTD